MPKKSSRQSPRSIATIEEILAVSALQISPNIEAISIKELAKSADLAIGTIYRVIPSKTELKALLIKYCEAAFNEIVFAPIPSKLDLRGRMSLVLARIFEFINKKPQIAMFLAHHGFGKNSLMVKSTAQFAKEGEEYGLMPKSTYKIAYYCVWGPLSQIIIDENHDQIDIETIETAIWSALSSVQKTN